VPSSSTPRTVVAKTRSMGTLSREILSLGMLAIGVLASMLLPCSTVVADIVWEDHFVDEQAITPGTSLNSGGTTVNLTPSFFTDSDGGTPDIVAERSATFNSFEAGTTGNHSGYLEFTFNNENDDPVDYVQLDLDFTTAIRDVRFSLLDVDGSTVNSWDDGVTVFINGINVRTNPAWYQLGSVVIEDNEAGFDGFEGIPQSAGANETTGNIDFDFGLLEINSISIRYFSTDDAIANPASQFIGLSDIQFTAVPEPNSAVILLGALGLLTLRRGRHLIR